MSIFRLNEKIIPFFVVESDAIQKEQRQDYGVIYHAFSKELAVLHSGIRYPVIHWANSLQDPQILEIYVLLESNNRSTDLYNVLTELFRTKLVPNKKLLFSRSKTLIFQEKGKKLFFASLALRLNSVHEAPIAEFHLEQLVHYLRYEPTYTKLIRDFFAQRKLPLHFEKLDLIDSVRAYMHRFPKLINQKIQDELHHFLLHLPENFIARRTTNYLRRTIIALYGFKKALESGLNDYPSKRIIFSKILFTLKHNKKLVPLFPRLSSATNLPTVLGVVVVMNSITEHENFDFKHILEAIQSICKAGISKIPKHTYFDHDIENGIKSFYIEFKKSNNHAFSSSEIQKLKHKLPSELHKCIEYLSPALVMRPNEEEICRNIISLAQELRFVGDLQQAFISFLRQKTNYLLFNVIILRILKKNSPSIKERSQKLPPFIKYIQERVAKVGTLRKKYVKEATVFLLEVPTLPFLRKNHSVDLALARQYIVTVLEDMVGPFRDFNGGFLNMQSRLFRSILDHMGKEVIEKEIVLENLFCSLNPISVQGSLPLGIGIELFRTFLQALSNDLLSKTSFCITESFLSAYSIFVFKMHLNAPFAEMISSLAKNEKLISGRTEVEGYEYWVLLFYSKNSKEHAWFEKKIHSLKTHDK